MVLLSRFPNAWELSAPADLDVAPFRGADDTHLPAKADGAQEPSSSLFPLPPRAVPAPERPALLAAVTEPGDAPGREGPSPRLRVRREPNEAARAAYLAPADAASGRWKKGRRRQARLQPSLPRGAPAPRPPAPLQPEPDRRSATPPPTPPIRLPPPPERSVSRRGSIKTQRGSPEFRPPPLPPYYSLCGRMRQGGRRAPRRRGRRPAGGGPRARPG